MLGSRDEDEVSIDYNSIAEQIIILPIGRSEFVHFVFGIEVENVCDPSFNTVFGTSNSADYDSFATGGDRFPELVFGIAIRCGELVDRLATEGEKINGTLPAVI